MRNIILFVLLLTTGALIAQKVTVEIGPEIKAEHNLDFWGHLHSDSSGHYVMMFESVPGLFSGGTTTPLLQKYDRKYNLVYSTELNSDVDDVDFGNMFFVGGKFVFCTQELNKKEKKLTCRATGISLAGKPEKPEKVAVVSYKEKGDKPTDIRWLVSTDSSKIAVSTVADDNNNDLKVKTSVNVLDEHLTKIWGKSFTLPYTQEQVTVKSWTVGNDGQVYLLAKVYDEKNNKESKKAKDGSRTPAYKMVIFRFSAGSEKPQEFRLDLNGKFVADLAFRLNAKNDLECGGFYTNDTKGVIRGVFFTRINGTTGTADVASIAELTAEDLASLDTQKDKGGERGLDNRFVFKNLIVRNDGGIILTAEEAYSVTSQRWNGRTYYTYTTYYNNEIFVTSINPDGKIDWTRMISKRQISNTNFFNGYALMVSGSNLYFLYNDDIDNVGRPLSQQSYAISSFSDAIASLVTLGADGNGTRRKAFGAREDSDALMVPGTAKQISQHELFFTTTKFKLFSSKRIRMGILKV
jgi:hypothetical protein